MKQGVAKEAIVLQWAVRTASCDFKPVESGGLVHCSVENAAKTIVIVTNLNWPV